MHRVTVQYAAPSDPAAFDEAYLTEHVPMVHPVPGLASFSYSKVVGLPPGTEVGVYQVAQLDFADEATMNAALGSAEMAAAAEHAAGLGAAMTLFCGEVITG